MARFPKGSNPKLTEELIETIAQAIRMGSYVETAAIIAGVSKDTFYRWLKQAKGDSPTAISIKLSDAVMRAMAESEIKDLEVIDQAAQNGNWKAAAWRLERRCPSRWGSPYRRAEKALSEEKEGNETEVKIVIY